MTMQQHIDGDDYTYPHGDAAALLDGATEPLRRFDLRTVDVHQAEQDRRLAVLEATIQEQNRRLAVLEHRVKLLEAAEVQP
jgi:hypothetical protein